MKSVKKLAFISLALGMLSSGLIASVAWFEPRTNAFSARISGSVVEEYFHCGKGTEDDPFVITRPVHYYHLTEFFQRETVLNVSSTESVTFGTDYLYFQVGYPLKENDSSLYVYDYDNTGSYTGTISTPAYSKTLNLSYFSGQNALMPIGTNEVPFFGSFDGGAQSNAANGITISNLNIKTSDTVIVNNVTTNRSTSDVGIFGYVADQKDASHKTTIANAYFDNLTIDLSGASGTVVSDTTHIDAHTDNEIYVGYIVGHIHTYTNYDTAGPTNAAPIHDIYVNNAKIEGGANGKSHFGYIGFADTIDGANGSDINLGDIIDSISGHGQGPDSWGGSVDMKNLYNRIQVVENEYGAVYNGNEHVSGYQYAGDYTLWNTVKDANTDMIHYLSGGSSGTGATKKSDQYQLKTITYSTTNASENEFYIKCNGYYLSLNSTADALENTTSPKTKWRINSDGYMFAVLDGTWDVARGKTLTRNVARFITLTSNYLGLSIYPDSSSLFEISSNKIYKKNSSMQLTLLDGSWLVKDASAGKLYKIHYGSSYMGTTNGSALTVTNAANAIGFSVTLYSSSAHTYIFNYYHNGVKKGLARSGSNVQLNNGNGNYWKNASTGTVLSNGNYLQTSNYVLKLNGSTWQATSGTTGNRAVIEEFTETFYEAAMESITSAAQITWGSVGTKSDTETYIPLNIAPNSLGAADSNVGYIVSGSNFIPSSGYTGDIRVANYKRVYVNSNSQTSDRLGNFVTNETNKTVNYYTINGSGTVTIGDTLTMNDETTAKTTIDNLGFTKFYPEVDENDQVVNDGARKQFLETITDGNGNVSSSVYGLHFMSALISETNKLSATNVKINKTTYTSSSDTNTYPAGSGVIKSNYELPRDCVDFNLKEDGRITFFAGSFYYSAADDAVGDTPSYNNSCFFSLHEITRTGSNNTEISDIKEIKNIYRKKKMNQGVDTGTGEIVYAYKNETDSYSGNSDYTLLFNTDWITNTSITYKRVYYFEIPVKTGEYALGSVANKDGAYLMYLDIGANGNSGEEEDYNKENGIADDPIFTQMEYVSSGYVINSCFNIAYAIPVGSTKENFWIKVSRNGTVFSVEVYNQTNAAFDIDILLVDNDNDSTNEYPYTYTLKYNNGSISSPYGYSASFRGAANGTAFVKQT